MPDTSRQWTLTGHGDFDVLKLSDNKPIPTPKGNEVLVQGKYLPNPATEIW